MAQQTKGDSMSAEESQHVSTKDGKGEEMVSNMHRTPFPSLRLGGEAILHYILCICADA